jgi:signal transduction histidine kinase
LEGRKFREFIPDDKLPVVLAGIAQLTLDEPTVTFEQPLNVSDGSTRDVLWTNRMIFKDGVASELISVGRDITSSKCTQRKIEDQAHALALRNQALEQFAGIVSHYLRSPLRHIRMYGEMLMENQSRGQVTQFPVYITKISDNIIRMERLIASLLEFSQMAYKQVNRSRFLLSAALDEAKDSLSNAIAEKNAIIELSHDTDLHLDYVLIVRLLQNLLDNAIKHTDDKITPMISVDSTYSDDQLIISVTDNGIGIDPEQAIRIFNVFQRLHVDERNFKGTGIGLALAKRIVEGYSGEIKLDADFRGGSRFVMSFPMLRNL